MGAVREHRPVMLMAAVFSRNAEAFEWFERRVVTQWGAIAHRGERLRFDQTQFYEQQMGTDLQKQLYAFEQLIDPEVLPRYKIQSNQWEEEFAASGPWGSERPLNIDPGYVSEAKLVLATTKDRDHRLYLGQGIYGEVTLFYRQGSWQSRPWTYPDYQQPEYHSFLDGCRQDLRQRYREELRDRDRA